MGRGEGPEEGGVESEGGEGGREGGRGEGKYLNILASSQSRNCHVCESCEPDPTNLSKRRSLTNLSKQRPHEQIPAHTDLHVMDMFARGPHMMNLFVGGPPRDESVRGGSST